MNKPTPLTTERHAAEMLQAMLAKVSAIRIRAIEFESQLHDRSAARSADLRAHVDVYGHPHTLLCKVKSGNQQGPICEALEQLRLHASGLSGSVIPLLIAPCLSSRMQAVCREYDIGYLDMEGNLRLVVDDIFILHRSQPCRTPHAQRRDSPRRRGLPPGRVDDLAAGAATAHRMAS